MDEPGDHEPPSDSALAVGLGRAEPAALLAVYDAYGSNLIGYAEFLLAARPHEDQVGDPHLADDAAAAVLDALLVAAGAVVDLTDPDRMRSWLLALTRNECLRRRPGPSTVSPGREVAELARRGMPEAEIVALLGDPPERALAGAGGPGDGVGPAWLRPALVAAGGRDGAARRAELTRRARPFEPDGFPVPLDRRRLSGRALAWSVAAAVAVALSVLMMVPAGGDAVALRSGPVLAAASPEPAAQPTGARPDEPLPTLASTPFRGAATSPAPEPTAADASGDGTPAPAPSATPPPRPDTDSDTADRGARTGRLSLTWSPEEDPDCGGEWTATLWATAVGAEVSSVTAAVVGGGSLALSPDGDGWSGRLSGLPTDRTVTVTVYGDGAVRSATDRLSADC